MIKLIAVDMDGTFLNDQKKYDRELFAKQLAKMKKQGIKFVVASGNQYLHLEKYFPASLKDICFVCENGALIVEKNQVIYEQFLDSERVNQIVEILLTNQGIALDRLILSGKQRSYILRSTKQEFIENGRFFYHNLQVVDSLYDIPDQIFKITVNFTPDKKAESLAELKASAPHQVTILTSGLKAVDIISSNAGKEKAIAFLQTNLSISDREIACFGDNLNDLGMIKKAAYGFVVENGHDELKRYAYKIIGNNNENAVLREIAKIVTD